MSEALDNGPRPAHRRQFLEPLACHAEALIMGLRKRDEYAWWDMAYLRLKGKGREEIKMPGWRWETDSRALVTELEKFLHAARNTIVVLGEKESRHGATRAALESLIVKLIGFFCHAQEIPSHILDYTTRESCRRSLEGYLVEFITTALDAASIPHPSMRLTGQKYRTRAGLTCLVKKFLGDRNAPGFSRLVEEKWKEHLCATP